MESRRRLRNFARTTLPLAGPALPTVATFGLQTNWNDPLWPVLIATDSANAAPDRRAPRSLDYGLLMAGSVLALLPVVIAFFFVHRMFIEGIMTTGIE